MDDPLTWMSIVVRWLVCTGKRNPAAWFLILAYHIFGGTTIIYRNLKQIKPSVTAAGPLYTVKYSLCQ